MSVEMFVRKVAQEGKYNLLTSPISVAARSKAWVYGLSFTGIAGANPAAGHGCLSVVSVVCCQVEVSATGRSLVQRIPIVCVSLNVIRRNNKPSTPTMKRSD
jgi:hypothetical protein